MYENAFNNIEKILRAGSVTPDALSHGNDEMASFLNKILLSYVREGEGQLGFGKLENHLLANFGSVGEGKVKLGQISDIRGAFLGLQQELYRS